MKARYERKEVRPAERPQRMIVCNYALNLFMPYLFIASLSFHAMGWQTFEPYAILAASVFIGRFNFKSGYSVAYCECHEIDLQK